MLAGLDPAPHGLDRRQRFGDGDPRCSPPDGSRSRCLFWLTRVHLGSIAAQPSPDVGMPYALAMSSTTRRRPPLDGCGGRPGSGPGSSTSAPAGNSPSRGLAVARSAPIAGMDRPRGSPPGGCSRLSLGAGAAWPALPSCCGRASARTRSSHHHDDPSRTSLSPLRSRRGPCAARPSADPRRRPSWPACAARRFSDSRRFSGRRGS